MKPAILILCVLFLSCLTWYLEGKSLKTEGMNEAPSVTRDILNTEELSCQEVAYMDDGKGKNTILSSKNGQ